MKENVYLIPFDNGTYAPCVADRVPRKNAILLTSEKSYPTLLAYVEYDAYGCGYIHSEQINNRAELLDSLFTCGEMCWGIVGLWDYDLYQNISDNLYNLFNNAYGVRMEAIRGDGAVNAAYAFVNTTTLEEYCAGCKNRCSKSTVGTADAKCASTENLDYLPFSDG